MDDTRTGESQLASDPATAPAILQGMANQSADASVLAALARNPSTPKNTLLRLWRNDPGAILENPIVFLWEFTKRGSSKSHLPKEAQFQLYQHLLGQEEFVPKPELIDPEWVAWHLTSKPHSSRFRLPLHALVRDETLRIRLVLLETCLKHASHERGGPVGFPHDALEDLCSDSRSEVREALAEAIAMGWLVPEPLSMDFVSRLAHTLIRKSLGNFSIREQIAKWPCLNAAIVERLSLQADESLLAVLVAHPNASPHFQERLAGHSSAKIRAGIASSTSLGHLQRRFVHDPSPLVCAGLAASPHLSREIQLLLYDRRDSLIILSFLKNPATIPEILEAISRLPNLAVASLLRGHPNTPPHVLDALPGD